MRAGAGALVDPSRWPLVGRDDELALGCGAVAVHGGVVLTGAAGVGKTRLAHEVLTQEAAAGDRMEWIAATQSAASVPLGAAAHLVPQGSMRRSRDAMLRAIVSALEHQRGAGRLLLGVDDAHLLDDASAALVHLLATTGTASVVVTVRGGELMPDPIVALWKDGPVPLVSLQELSRDEVEELVTSVLEGPIEGALLHLFWESSAGNPLFLGELVRHGIESGALCRERGLWRWPGQIEPGERLQDLVALRMGSLDQDERAALELVAVGEPLARDGARALGIAAVLARLEERGLVVSPRATATEIGLSHPLFGEVVQARMPATRADEVRLRLADALEATSGGQPADQFRIVLWRADAGELRRPDELRAAARRAWTLWAAPVAERLARAALEFGPDLEAGYLLGEALSDQGQVDEALAVWEAIEDLPGPDRVRAALAIAHASALNYRLGCRADAERVLARAAGRIQDGSAARLIDGALALFGATDRLVWDADADALPAVEPSVALAAALELTASGRFEAATRTVDAAIATREIWGEEFPSVELFLQLVRAWSRLLGGHVREVEAEAEVRYAAAVRERADYPRARWCLMRGLVGVIQGSPRHAISALHEGVAVTGADDRGWLRPMHVLLAMAAALAGDITAAEDSERRADEANRSIDGLFGVDAARSRAWVLAVRGELTAAADQARQAGELAVAHEQWAFEALALHDLARFGQAKEAAGRLEELAGVVDGSLVDALAAHARALAGDDGAALDAVSATFGSLGLDLFAAEASAAAARAHQREGRKASAYASRGRAREFAAGCEGAQTPALAWLERPSDLTAREREVAELAASGLTSRVIGGRLGITTRTVDNLLGRVYVKFEISGRRELVKLAGRPRE